MARTLTQIYNEIVASKESSNTLEELLPNPDSLPDLYTYENFKLIANSVIKETGQSKVAIWRLIMFSVAYGIWLQETMYDIFKSEVELLTSDQGVGQLQWYTRKSKEFQYGYQLELVNDTYYGYNTIDEDSQIISQAAAIVSNGIVYLKVAKGDIGSLEALTADEKTAFERYMKGSGGTIYANNGIAPAGVKLNVISADPDEVKMAIEVYYDSLVLDSTGTLLSDGATKPVEDAITNYIQQIPYDSKFRIIDLIDAIQSASGVVNVVLNNCDAKNSTQAWIDSVDVTSETGQQYVSYAGYLKIGDDYALDGYYDYPTNLIPSITYIAE